LLLIALLLCFLLQAAYVNLEISAEEKEKGNAAFKEQR